MITYSLAFFISICALSFSCYLIYSRLLELQERFDDYENEQINYRDHLHNMLFGTGSLSHELSDLKLNDLSDLKERIQELEKYFRK